MKTIRFGAELELLHEFGGALNLHVAVVGVAGGAHPVCKEQAARLCLGVVAVFLFAAVHEALLDGRVTASGVFAIGEQSAVLGTCARESHFFATVKRSYAASGNHEVELSAGDIVAHVARHDYQLFASEAACASVSFVFAGSVECQQVAFAAIASAARRGCECVCQVVVDCPRDLAHASSCGAAVLANGSFACACEGAVGVASPCCRIRIGGP